ncbi:MAG: adenylate/guanylate cyclase domain-containing protein [Actinomycetota bacterium]
MELSRSEVAERAGVEVAYIDRLVDADILRPDATDGFSLADARRTRFVRNLELAGVSLDGMAVAVREGTLSFSYLDAGAFDEPFATVSGTTFRELSARTGVPVELLSVVREAVGFAEPRPNDLVREDELDVVPAIELQLANGFSPAAIERLLRVMGDSLRRIAGTESDFWSTEVMRAMLASGMSESDMLDAQAELGTRMMPLMERALLGIYHGQQQHAWSQSSVEMVERALERSGVPSGPHGPPAMCFLDITGYTRLAEERGDEAAADVATSVATLVRRTSAAHGGQPVKWLGDGVMFFFRDPGQGVLAALEMVEGLAHHELPPAHVGVHAGPVVFQEGDYFGRTVNLAARIADEARPGEVLVSQEVVDAAAGGTLVTFTEIGPVELKGVSGPRRLYAARAVR